MWLEGGAYENVYPAKEATPSATEADAASKPTSNTE
jgi:hypothetical protein